jgi:hypothetical protein
VCGTVTRCNPHQALKQSHRCAVRWGFAPSHWALQEVPSLKARECTDLFEYLLNGFFVSCWNRSQTDELPEGLAQYNEPSFTIDSCSHLGYRLKPYHVDHHYNDYKPTSCISPHSDITTIDDSAE